MSVLRPSTKPSVVSDEPSVHK